MGVKKRMKANRYKLGSNIETMDTEKGKLLDTVCILDPYAIDKVFLVVGFFACRGILNRRKSSRQYQSSTRGNWLHC